MSAALQIETPCFIQDHVASPSLLSRIAEGVRNRCMVTLSVLEIPANPAFASGVNRVAHVSAVPQPGNAARHDQCPSGLSLVAFRNRGTGEQGLEDFISVTNQSGSPAAS